MKDWVNKPIVELGRVITGKTPPMSESKYFNGEHMFVSPKDLEYDKLYVNDTQTTITGVALKKFKNQVLSANAVMFTSLSYSFGKIGIASESCLTNQQINSVIVTDRLFGNRWKSQLRNQFRRNSNSSIQDDHATRR